MAVERTYGLRPVTLTAAEVRVGTAALGLCTLLTAGAFGFCWSTNATLARIDERLKALERAAYAGTAVFIQTERAFAAKR